MSVTLSPGEQPQLIEIWGDDVHFRSAVVDASGKQVSEVELPFLRSTPVYHFVDSNQEGALQLQIEPIQFTSEASFTVNFHTVTAGNEHQEVTSAWQELADGLQFVEGEGEADWAPSLEALEQAADAFQSLGDQQRALWARYFGAYFRYFPLYRYQESLAQAQELLKQAGRADLPRLEMLAHQLIGQILIEQDPEIYGPQRDIYSEAKEHFDAAVNLAIESKNGFELVWAHNNLGITAQYQDDPERSLDEYARALELAIALKDHYLVSLIGMNMAVSQESLGQINKAIETLLRIEGELVPGGAPAELEHLWSLLGGYYLKRYEFPKALETVDRALVLSEELGIAESLGRNQLLLAQIYRELGQAEKSLQNIELAIPNLEASRSGRGLRRAHALAADLHREGQQFEAMQEARMLQEQYLRTESDRARWLWAAAEDAQAWGRNEEARELYRESMALFEATPFRFLGQLAKLQACALSPQPTDHETCNTEQLSSASMELLNHEASGFQLEGRYLMARMLASEGKLDAARAEMEMLINDLSYYRQELPGVLGAWYWDARSDIFNLYLQLALQGRKNKVDSAYDSLAALNRLRNLGLQSASASPRTEAPEDRSTQLRQLLARRDAADSQAELEKAERNIDLLLVGRKVEPARSTKLDDASRLRQDIARLPEDWSLLTYHLGEEKVLAWTATREGLQLHELGRGDEIKNLLRQARAEIRTIHSTRLAPLLETLGTALFAPVAGSLTHNILLIPAGALSDFPFEALVVDGQFLIENHSITNAMSLNNVAATIANFQQPLQPEKILLAGDPEPGGNSQPMLAGAYAELKSVAERFPNAQSHLYSQAHLQLEVFRSAEFAEADLVHIASHASVNTLYPELSTIELSDDFLTPADLAGEQISANLVVLSACNTAGLNRFDYDSHLGFVSEFMVAGASGVMASLWPIPDRRTAEFFEVLYADIVTSGQVAPALRRTKLKMINAGQAGVDLWVAIQYYGR